MDIINSYRALETAIRETARRYYLVRNPGFAANSELPQCRQDRQHRSGLFHGDTGNWRAHNILMVMHELPKDQESPQCQYQLLLLLFAILQPNHAHNTSGWLAELLRAELIQGTCWIKETETTAFANTLSSPIFSMNVIQDSIQHAMIDYSSDCALYHRYEKSYGICYILRTLYLQMSHDNKKGFDNDLRQLENKLIKKPKIDNSEVALAIEMQSIPAL